LVLVFNIFFVYTVQSSSILVITQNLFELPEEIVKETQNRRRTIGDSITYMSPRGFTSIVRPTMNEKIVEMKHEILQLINSHQFSSLNHEDPHTHLYTFYELCDSVLEIVSILSD